MIALYIVDSLILVGSSSNGRLGECVRPKMDSRAVAKEPDLRHTMPFNTSQNMEQRGRVREESHHATTATFWRKDCMTSQKNICLQNKLEFVFYLKGFAVCFT